MRHIIREILLTLIPIRKHRIFAALFPTEISIKINARSSGMIELSDLELIKQVKKGDEAAFEHLFRRYEPLIAKIARKYYVRGYETEDFYQIGALAFYKAALSFEEKENSTFYGYVLSCVRNKIVSQCRKYLFNVTYDTDYEDISVVMEAHKMYTVEKSEILEEEQGTNLHTYRTELSKLFSEGDFFGPLERKCLEGFIEGLSYLEIAEKYDIDIKKVDNALMRIRAKIRKRDFTD